jgi:endonuclease YncB( thermonuclease family)
MFLRPRILPGADLTLSVAGLIFILGLTAGGALINFAPPGAAIGRLAGERAVARPAAAESGFPAEVLRVIDGDTFEARVHVWPGLDITTKVRLRGIDAPEMKADCRSEAVKAEAARMALQLLLSRGDVSIARVTPDKYGGRVVADAMTRSTPDVSAAMLEAGHVRRYTGGRRDGWCG